MGSVGENFLQNDNFGPGYDHSPWEGYWPGLMCVKEEYPGLDSVPVFLPVRDSRNLKSRAFKPRNPKP